MSLLQAAVVAVLGLGLIAFLVTVYAMDQALASFAKQKERDAE